MRNCTSSNGAKDCPNAAMDWEAILAQDPALHGIRLDDVVFSRSARVRRAMCELSSPNLQKLASVPEPLLPVALRDALCGVFTQPSLRGAGLDCQELQRLLASQVPGTSCEWEQPHHWAVIVQCLAPATPAEQRPRELRTVRYLTDRHSKAIYEAIVAAARQGTGAERPRIGVITAASDNPYEEADINVYALRSAGADAVYIPIEIGMRRALDAGHEALTDLYYEYFANFGVETFSVQNSFYFADYASQRKELAANGGQGLNALLASLDGLYFSGGDQARILDAFVNKDHDGQFTLPSEQWQIIQQRHAQGKLVVAGTSAGNHIQGGGHWKGRPVPMIGGGDSYPALATGFLPGNGSAVETPGTARIYPHGGLGVFPWGVLDSHFSERCREGRLARATLEAGMDYGFGIDENTALVVHRPDADGTTRMQVLGEHGVWIVDVHAVRRLPNSDRTLRAENFLAHHLHEGDSIEIDTHGRLCVALGDGRPQLPCNPGANIPYFDRIQDYESHRFADLVAAMGHTGATQAFGDTRNSSDGRTQQNHDVMSLALSRAPDTCFRGDEKRASYTAVRLAFNPTEL